VSNASIRTNGVSIQEQRVYIVVFPGSSTRAPPFTPADITTYPFDLLKNLLQDLCHLWMDASGAFSDLEQVIKASFKMLPTRR
jgi:hypothetical protein